MPVKMSVKQLQNATLPVFQKLISSNDVISWQQIGAAVTNANIVVDNWMHVRAVLQGLINAGWIVRTSNIHVEEYKVLKKPA